MRDFESELARQVEALPEEVSPQRDLWRGIALGLETGKQAPARRTAHWSALVASAVAVAVVCFSLIWQNGDSPENKMASGNALVQVISQQHQAQVEALLIQFDGQAALSSNWKSQLTELENAATAIKRALEEDPDNTALLGMLQHVYQQQLLLIERVHAPKWQQI
ncbi:hypothetical protein [Aestuariibacter sp. A3R04]|uniref:hypothetical protein n=1 Tax=Aestuariibacter sp. A3R04 TaxID=2841571 RepID=UPI00352E6C66